MKAIGKRLRSGCASSPTGRLFGSMWGWSTTTKFQTLGPGRQTCTPQEPGENTTVDRPWDSWAASLQATLQPPCPSPSDPNRDLGGGWICETKCKVLCQITCEVKYKNICQINFPNTCQNVRRLSDPWRNTKTCMSKLACKSSKITWSKRGSETRCRCSAMRVQRCTAIGLGSALRVQRCIEIGLGSATRVQSCTEIGLGSALRVQSAWQACCQWLSAKGKQLC